MLSRKIVGTAVTLLLGLSSATAAELGPSQYNSYRDLHLETSYGALFFNESAIRAKGPRSNESLKRFWPVIGIGDLILPKQNGYCFVINHYTGNPDEAVQLYRVDITKTLLDGNTSSERVEEPYTPTSDPVSARLPSVCISGIANVTRIGLRFSSTHDTSFNREIAFRLD